MIRCIIRSMLDKYTYMYYYIEQMKLLTRIEEIILMTVIHLDDNAYGITIRRRVEELTGRKYAVGAIYVPLDRLDKKGFLNSHFSDPSSERGGRKKRIYEVSAQGMKALKDIKLFHEELYNAVPVII